MSRVSPAHAKRELLKQVERSELGDTQSILVQALGIIRLLHEDTPAPKALAGTAWHIRTPSRRCQRAFQVHFVLLARKCTALNLFVQHYSSVDRRGTRKVSSTQRN